jgi:hypothetical protein
MPHALSPELLQALMQLDAVQQDALLQLLQTFFPPEKESEAEKTEASKPTTEEDKPFRYAHFEERKKRYPSYYFYEGDNLPPARDYSEFPPTEEELAKRPKLELDHDAFADMTDEEFEETMRQLDDYAD